VPALEETNALCSLLSAPGINGVKLTTNEWLLIYIYIYIYVKALRTLVSKEVLLLMA
jgi:hypothetical protein